MLIKALMHKKLSFSENNSRCVTEASEGRNTVVYKKLNMSAPT